MVAIAVLLSMAMVVWSTMAATIDFNDALSTTDQTTRSARVVLSKLRRDIQLAFLTRNRQATESYRTVFVAEDNSPDTLYFSTLAHQRLYRDSRECDQAEITVWAEDSPSEKGNGYILYHRESERIDEEPAEGGRVLPLAYNVRSFEMRFLDSRTNEWLSEWDSRGEQRDRLPRAVEIGLVLIARDPLDPDDTIDIPHVTRVMLSYAESLQPLLFQSADGTMQGDGR